MISHSTDIISYANQYFEIEGVKTLQRPNYIVEVGLVGERHEIYSIKKYIFEKSLTQEQLLDFNYQYEHAKEFLKDNIENEKQTLMVYCTGLQSVLATVIKACHDMEINLILKHMNTNTKSYDSQVIWDFGHLKDVSYPFESIKTIYGYKCKLSDVLEAVNVYAITLTTVDKNDYSFTDKQYIIATDVDDAWNLYQKFVMAIKDELTTTYNNVQISTMTVKANSYQWNEVLSQSYNYTKAS